MVKRNGGAELSNRPVEVGPSAGAKGTTSPMLFAALVFGLPLLLIVLLAALDLV